jgi:hypothetical protein
MFVTTYFHGIIFNPKDGEDVFLRHGGDILSESKELVLEDSTGCVVFPLAYM